jgi:hypothetical protein
MALTKETYTGEAHLKEQLDILRKYIYNVGQRHVDEIKEQRIQGIPNVLNTMGNLVDEIVRRRNKECDALNHKFGDV